MLRTVVDNIGMRTGHYKEEKKKTMFRMRCRSDERSCVGVGVGVGVWCAHKHTNTCMYRHIRTDYLDSFNLLIPSCQSSVLARKQFFDIMMPN